MTDDRQSNAIRPARQEDGPAILAMLAELAAFEGAADRPRLDAAALAKDVFGPAPKLNILVAEQSEENEPARLVGFLSYFENYSSWAGQAGIHIGDLWVSRDSRGQHVGSALLRDAVGRHGGERIDVFVIRGSDARYFYEQQGFKEQAEWCLYRIERRVID
jgi:GNAT superfamily N-acetyltransferase